MRKNNESNLDGSIKLTNIYFDKNYILFRFNKLNYAAWLENANKHTPEVYSLRKLNDNTLAFDVRQLPKGFVHSRLILSIADNNERLPYKVLEEALKVVSDPFFHLNPFCDDRYLCFDIVRKGNKSTINHLNSILSEHDKIVHPLCRDVIARPIDVCVIGSCFSRNVFQSNSYFNPEYKKHFRISNTFFHNSIISMMSKPFTEDEYILFEDLQKSDVANYVAMEFNKNLEAILNERSIDYVFIDNYSEAALPIVEMEPGRYLTYNRYFSESIFRKEFAGKKIIHPGSSQHIKLYEKSLTKLAEILKKFQLDKKLILVGGRLSIQKTASDVWLEKIQWINSVNTHWDIYDSIFLEKLPLANYIDVRKSVWLSDLDSPIKGGASPAHYQSGFYKNIYTEIKNIILGCGNEK